MRYATRGAQVYRMETGDERPAINDIRIRQMVDQALGEHRTKLPKEISLEILVGQLIDLYEGALGNQSGTFIIINDANQALIEVNEIMVVNHTYVVGSVGVYVA